MYASSIVSLSNLSKRESNVDSAPSFPLITLVRTDLLFIRLKCWKTIPICDLTFLNSSPLIWVIFFSKKLTDPDVGSINLLIHLKRVDLPDPLRPIITRNSPGCTEKETPFKA